MNVYDKSQYHLSLKFKVLVYINNLVYINFVRVETVVFEKITLNCKLIIAY